MALQDIKKKLDDPSFAKKTHGWLSVIWLVLAVPICIFLSSSVPFLVFISVYAVVASHWAGWDAAGGELEIEKIKKRLAKVEKKA